MIIKFFIQHHFPMAALANINNLGTPVPNAMPLQQCSHGPATSQGTVPPCPRDNKPKDKGATQAGLAGGVKRHYRGQ